MTDKRFILAIIAAHLIGCGSGGPEPIEPPVVSDPTVPVQTSGPSTVHFEGIWQGTVTPDDTQTSSWAIAIVNGWGEMRLLTRDAQFVGAPRRTQSALKGDLIGLRSAGTTWSDGSGISPFTIDGSIASDEFIDADYSGPTVSGALAMAWEPDAHSTDIQTIGGTWASFDRNQNIIAALTFDVFNDDSARISGSHANGCTYSGTTESWTSVNSYDIWQFAMSGCPFVAGVDVNGDYSGSAARIDLADDGTDELALVVALSNDEVQQTIFLYKQ